jgi:hypothetical protein
MDLDVPRRLIAIARIVPSWITGHRDFLGLNRNCCGVVHRVEGPVKRLWVAQESSATIGWVDLGSLGSNALVTTCLSSQFESVDPVLLRSRLLTAWS